MSSMEREGKGALAPPPPAMTVASHALVHGPAIMVEFVG